MAVYQGTGYSKDFYISTIEGGPTDISSWQLQTHIRDSVNDDAYLVELTTENGGWVIVDGGAGHLRMVLTDDDTNDLVEGWVVGDLMRVNATNGPSRVFGFRIRVKKPVTRNG